MPNYSFACPKCGLMRVLFRPIERRDQPVYCVCHKTQQVMARQPDAPAVYPEGLKP